MVRALPLCWSSAVSVKHWVPVAHVRRQQLARPEQLHYATQAAVARWPVHATNTTLIDKAAASMIRRVTQPACCRMLCHRRLLGGFEMLANMTSMGVLRSGIDYYCSLRCFDMSPGIKSIGAFCIGIDCYCRPFGRFAKFTDMMSTGPICFGIHWIWNWIEMK